MRHFEDDVDTLIKTTQQEKELWLDPSTDEFELSATVLDNIKKLYQHNLPRLLHVLYTEYEHPRKPELIAYFTDVYRKLVERNYGVFAESIGKKLLSASSTHPRLYITWYILFFDRWMTDAFIAHYTRKHGNSRGMIVSLVDRYADESAKKHSDDFIAAKTLYNAMLED